MFSYMQGLRQYGKYTRLQTPLCEVLTRHIGDLRDMHVMQKLCMVETLMSI